MAVIFKDSKRKTILQALAHTIEAKGGLVMNCDGDYAPVADEDWTDLAEVYLQACEALHRRPMIQGELDCDDEED
jgi:hypothetical protein